MSSIDRLNPFNATPATPDAAPDPTDAIEMAATPDAAQALDEAYAAVANSARMHQQTTQVSLPPIPDETILNEARQQDKGTAVGTVMQVLAGAASGSIEDLVAQAVAIRSSRNNRETQGLQQLDSAKPRAPRRQRPRGRVRGVKARHQNAERDDEAEEEEEATPLEILRRGAAVLRAPSGGSKPRPVKA